MSLGALGAVCVDLELFKRDMGGLKLRRVILNQTLAKSQRIMAAGLPYRLQ